MKPQLYIGIDPDVNKSGFALYWTQSKELILQEYSLYDLFNQLMHYKDIGVVRLEAGHKDKRTWHKGGNGMAKRVGANNEIGRQIERFCNENGIQLQLVKPCGLSSYSHEHFCKVTGWNINIKTNPEKRVAGLLVWGI